MKSHCKMLSAVIALVALWAIPGCTSIADLFNPPSPDVILGASFARMEERLLDAHEFELHYVITAEGAFTANLEGGIKLKKNNVAEIWGTGNFGGDFMDYSFTSNGNIIFASIDDGSFDADVPAELNRAIILGMTRMGLLHNVVRILSGELPDHASGGVDEWVTVSGFSSGPQQKLDGRSANAIPVHFGLTVDGVPSGTATIWEEATLRIPLGRDQVVQFETGEMRVKERYSQIIIRDAPREILIEGE